MQRKFYVSSSTWQSGVSGDWTNGSDWSSGAPAAGAVANITASGTYVVTLFGSAAASGLVLNAQGAEFYDAGALNLTGTLALQAGTLALAYGAFNGGTIAMQGGSFLATGGLLNGVAVDGTLNMSTSNETLFVQNGLRTAGLNGSGTGSIALTGAYSSIDFLGSQVLNNTVVALGSIGSQPGQTGAAGLDISHAGGATSGATLTIGANSWVRDLGGQAQLVAGSISPVTGASLADSLVNQGTITAMGVGGTLSVAGNGNFVNQGTLAVSNGALLEISTAGFQNTGMISVSNATLALGGTYATSLLANLGSVTLSNGQVELLGTARNTGTLTLGAGSAISGSLGALALAGTMVGGTVVDNGGGVSFAAGTGTLSGVTYQGALTLGTAAAGVTLLGNTQMTGANGANGTAVITGNAAMLSLQGNETLNATNITLGAAGQAASIGTSDAWLASAATTATLGAGVTVQQGGANAALDANAFSPFAGFGLSDTLVNQGAIQANVSGGTFLNQGAIGVGNGDMLAVSAQIFGNTGTITVGAGGTMTLGGNATAFGAATTWSNAGQIVVNGGNLVLGGTLTTAQMGIVTASTGTVQLTGTLNNAGSTLTLGTASALNTFSLGGTILGGTIADQSGALSIGGSGTGLLDGVTDNGTLSVTNAGAVLRVRDGLTVNGTANITGAGAGLDFLGSQSFNNAAVTLGSASAGSTIALAHGTTTAGASMLCLGSGLSITQTGQFATIGAAGGVAGDSIVSAGTITAGVYGGTLTLGGPGFTNQGKISVSNGETLALQAAQFSNTGTIAVSNAVLSLGGSLSLAALGTLALSNASVAVAGTLSLGTGTLAIGAGTAMGRVSLTGTIAGGTIIDNGQGLAGAGTGDLSGVTYRGLLDLSRPFAQISISQGITLTGVSGSGTGSIALTGAASRLISASTQTLNTANITLGSGAQVYFGQALAAPELDAAAGTQLTIGATTTINAAGTAGTLGNAGLGQWTDSIVNAGHINVGLAGATLNVGSSSFANSGVLNASAGGVLVLGSAATTNTGTIAIGTGSTVQLGLYNYFADPMAGAVQFTNQSSIVLSGGTFHEMTSNGLFPGVPVVNTGLITGTGIVATAMTNNGTIDAHGGVLSIQGPVTGAGTLQIDAGATLDMAASVGASEVARFTSTTGTLKIEQPATFAGTVANMVGGDVIDLVGQTLTSVSLSGGALVAKTATSTFTIHGQTALTGTVIEGSDGHGGANIAIVPQSGSGVGAAKLVLAVTQPKMMFFTATNGDVLTGSSANMNGLTTCNWSNASSLDITDLSPTAAKLTATPGTATTGLAFTDGTHTGSLVLGASLGQSHFTLASDGHGGTLITTH
jgi:fibronectin-binding autotransporter adhesin